MVQLTQIDNREAGEARSSFDYHNPPAKELLSDCVHCGFCLPACPTYVLWGEEMDSPRGRIYMMAKASQGEAPLDEVFAKHMDNCLGCMACMTACPSGVQYNQLIENTRFQVEQHVPRSTEDSLFRRLLFAVFPHSTRLRWLAMPAFLYQRSGLESLVRASGLLRLLPQRAAAMEALLPRVSKSTFRRLPVITPAQSGSGSAATKKIKVGMLAGCVQQVFFQHVNEATVRVLAAEGYDVVVPPGQGCCGALMVHSGVERDAREQAKKMIETFEATEVDYIVVNAAGCGSTMKEYGHLLSDDPLWSDRAKRFSAKCRDVAEVLLLHPPRQVRNPLPLRVAYQDACHLRHAQGIFEEPRSLLRDIPSLELREIAEPNLCCGSAGVYNLLHPEPAMQLGDRKVENLLRAEPQVLVSANPGCLLQIQAGLRRRGIPEMPTFHMVELLDASIRGVQVDDLLNR
ncbi:MAG TPA: heterodisulfide reductase-related iron-sulfur binding cluster [Edaphobacter sp.]|nr:heterodisulfide reductase-related iron-sulfur binding cluster [Edaphobacter sp.]